MPTETLCLDAGYVGDPVLVTSRKHKYLVNLKTRREEMQDTIASPGHKARRWMDERTHSWLNRLRQLLVSFEKTEASYLAQLSLAEAIDLLATNDLYLRISS